MSHEETLGQVALPSTYHSKEKLAYADWRFAWFREALQNEHDAGATRIDFSVGVHPENPQLLRVVCQGNGHGMDKNRLFNSFLTMGGSQKGEGSIGGFGYAKVILAFAHEHYEIETQGIHVKGEGSHYRWSEGHAEQPGVRLCVDMSRADSDVWSLTDGLKRLLANSDLPSNLVVTLNGDVQKTQCDSLPYHTETALGHLSFKDQPHGCSSSVLWIRIRGMAMFQYRIYNGSGTAFEGHLELEGDSKSLLTANRDSLNDEHRDVLNQIINQLITDREKLKLSGDIDVLLNRRDVRLGQFDDDFRRELAEAAEKEGMTEEAMLDQLATSAESTIDERAKHPFARLVSQVAKTQDEMKSRLSKIPQQWYPDNFQVKYLDESGSPEDAHRQAGEIATCMNLKRYGKMAAGWHAIVMRLLASEPLRESLRILKVGDGQYQHEGMMVQTGFVFGTPEGLCKRDDKKKRVSIMVNPKTIDGQNLTPGDVIDIAMHELTHLDVEYHGEGFTMKESRLWRILRREMGEAELVKCFKGGIAAWREQQRDNAPQTPGRRNQRPDDSIHEM